MSHESLKGLFKFQFFKIPNLCVGSPVQHIGNELISSVRKHNSNHKGFTGGVGDWIIAYSESYATKQDAYAKEREVKRWKSGKKIELLIHKV